MSEWKEYKLSDFIDINPKVKLATGKSYSFVEMKDLNENKKFVFPSQNREIKGGARFQNDDTLFARITPCLENGKICQVKGLNGEIGFGSTEFLVFRGKEGVSKSDFVYYLSRYDVFRKFAEQNMIGTSGRQRVSKEVFDNIELPLPDLPTQTSIASILSSLDDKIELNNAINKNLEALAQALFKHWFVDFEFPFDFAKGKPDEHGKPYKSSGGEMGESELGEIPKGWRVVSVNEIISVRDGTHNSPKQVQEGRFLITSKHLKENFIDFQTAYRISENDYFEVNKRSKVDKYDILITMIGTVGNLYFISEKPEFAIKNIGLYKSSENEMFSYYLFEYLKSSNIKKYFEERLAGSTQQYITLSALRELPIIYEIRTIEKFSETIKALRKLIFQNAIENQNISALRDTLLPKLISGELEVNEALSQTEKAL